MDEKKTKNLIRRTAPIWLNVLALMAIGISLSQGANLARAADACNDHIIISQVYGGGGNSGANFKNDFIELYNPTTKDVSMENWSVQYATTNGSFTSVNITILSKEIIKARSYYLVAEAKGGGGTEELPIPDKSGTTNLSASAGKVALARSAAAVIFETDTSVEDFVNYNTGSNTKSVFRDFNACPNTFYTDIPNPRNSNISEISDEGGLSDEKPAPEKPTDSDNASDTTEKCVSSSQNIKLNEIFPYPEKGNEFVEIINTGESCVDISGWKIMDEAGHKKEFPENSIIGSGKYIFLEGNLYLNNDSDTVYLLEKNGGAKEDALDSRHFEKAQEGFSYSFDGEGWHWTSTPTPEKKNVIMTSTSNEDTSNADSEKIYASVENVYLNEIFPNPKKDSDGEYVEIVNGESGPVDLRGWMIRDASKSGKYIINEHIEIGPGEYLPIYKSQSKIALNNSKESVYLYNPQGEITSNVSYEKSQKDASFNLDGENWKWSKYLTPGKKNEFDSQPSVKIKKPKSAFKDIFTEFSATAKDKETKKLKYTWNFGDGKKSYLAKTSHKYLDTGKYTVTLTVGDDSQEVAKSFVLAVKKFPRPNLKIVRIVPNPAGNDSDGEIIDIKNNSEKRIDLAGWKISTSSENKVYNHPISGELILETDETKAVTREFSKFSLNNKVGTVQLVMPDGKVTDVVEYQKEKIAEGEAYVKTDGEWLWIASLENKKSSEEDPEEINNEENLSAEGEVLGATEENIPYYAPPEADYISEDAYIFFKLFGLLEYKPREANFCPAVQPANTLAYF